MAEGAVEELENGIGADLLRADLLGAARPSVSGRYVVERLLGRGARGVVVAARDDRLGRRVALKLVPHSSADDEAIEEGRALARLEHPNVVRVYDVDVADAVFDGKPHRIAFVSMQLHEGRTLRSWLAVEGRTVDEVLAVFRAAGEGLAAAHDARIVHRDFKPDNVLVTEDGAVKVVDFGFAVPDAATMSFRGHAASDVVGTASYLAPEAREGHASSKSDQYAFAVALREALESARDDRRELEALLVRASDADPARRFPSMRALLVALAPRSSRAPVLGLVLASVALVAAGLVFTVPKRATAARCEAIAGEWSFTGRVDRKLGDVTAEEWAAYRVSLVPVAACRFDVHVSKYTDSGATGRYDWAGNLSNVVSEVAKDGTVSVRGQVILDRPRLPDPYDHAFDWKFRDGRVRGRFSVLDRRNGFREVYAGAVEGRRDAVP